MPRFVVRAVPVAFALAAVAAVIPLAPQAPAVADSIVVGGSPARIADSPWTVALSSRDRFGGTRDGQFCGAVAIAPAKVLTAAHCLRQDVLGVGVSQVRDLRIIARPGGAERTRRPGDPGAYRMDQSRLRPAHEQPAIWRC